MDDVNSDNGSGVSRRSQFGKQFLIWGGVVLIAFLLGFVPMWWTKRTVSNELEQTKLELKRQKIQNSLAAAAVYAKRGEYEPARQNVSTFFTDIQSEVNDAGSPVLTTESRSQVSSLLSGRDEIITLLSRADPAAADRVSDMYAAYRAITSAGPQK